MKKLTISIVTYNGANYLPQLLLSLSKQTWQDFDLIVVDNNSQDKSLLIVQQYFANTKIFAQNKNLGFGSGHNIAISQSQTPWILLLNQDVKLAPNCLEELMKATKNQRMGAIGPQQLLFNNAVDSSGINKKFYFAYRERKNKHPTGKVWGVSGSIMLLRRQALEKVAYKGHEYFDSNFFMYKEDLDLIERFHHNGWQCWYQASALAYHDRTSSYSRSRKADYINEHSYKNHWFLIIKHAEWWRLPIVVVYELIKASWLVIFEPKSLRAWPEIFSKFSVIKQRRHV